MDNTEEKIAHIERIVDNMEVRLRNIETNVAVSGNDLDSFKKYFESKLNSIEKSQEDTKQIINRLVWVIIIAIVGGFMQFLLTGGLNVPGTS